MTPHKRDVVRTAVMLTGSREWRDWEAIRGRLMRYPAGTVLLHGNCGRVLTGVVSVIGADLIGAAIGKGFGFHVWALPYFDDMRLRGGPARNQCMFDVLLTLRHAGYSCFVEGFPMGDSVGTRGCLRIVANYNADRPHGPSIPVCITERTE